MNICFGKLPYALSELSHCLCKSNGERQIRLMHDDAVVDASDGHAVAHAQAKRLVRLCPQSVLLECHTAVLVVPSVVGPANLFVGEEEREDAGSCSG